jgi:hypothetical protein
MGQFQGATEQRWRESLRDWVKGEIHDQLIGIGEKGTPGESGADGSSGPLPFSNDVITTNFTIPDSSLMGVVNLYSHNLAGDTTITLPQEAEGTWGFLHFVHLIDGAASTAKFYVKDSAGNIMARYNTGGLPWSVGEHHWSYLCGVESTNGTLFWSLALLRNYTALLPPAI